MATQTPTSSIAMALAGKTASVDIPKPRFGYPSGAHGPRSGHPTMLPTPPNSISPTLPPHGFRRRDSNPLESPPLATSHVDSDIDLGDANNEQRNTTAHDLEAVGAITPGMLAKYHLPEILLQHGPLAIRHVTGYLTTSVPGFSGIPPAKARRLVVAALEGRGGDEQRDVIYEKVGWGRWDARRRGEPSRDAHRHEMSPASSLSDTFPYRGMQIPRRDSLHPYGSSVTGGSAVFSYTDMEFGGREDMLEHEADKMSLDGIDPEYCSSSPAPDDEIRDEDWDEEDITDEEDWAHIGADALRARSLNTGGGFVSGIHPPQLHGGGPASSSLAKSAPRGVPIQQLGFSLPDSQERAAVEALLRLGSM
ncbi:putative Sin3 binding protein-domain-containing protein [Aspergillus cavernicola]|uniref:Sin3 binding protein-domain-containing protein n=1 Tax=Aspergillus cavernicola TaxID=176166 RepID=A0ABR4IGH8_9EURO